MFLFGLVIYFTFLLAAVCSGWDVGVFIDASSLALLIGALLAVTVSTGSMGLLKYSFKASIKDDYFDKKLNDISIEFLDLLFKSSIGIGIIGFMIGIIIMMHSLSDPVSIGPSFGVAMLVLFYSLLTGFVLILPMKFILKRKSSK